jgi:polysaccharide biosynthesis transport protein
LITSGPSPSDPVKILSSFQLQSLIDLKKHQYDLILIDTPPVIGMVDAIKVASICDGTVLIMRLDKVKTPEVIEATTLLSKLNVLGMVANDSKETTSTYKTKSSYLLPQEV